METIQTAYNRLHDMELDEIVDYAYHLEQNMEQATDISSDRLDTYNAINEETISSAASKDEVIDKLVKDAAEYAKEIIFLLKGEN